MKCPTCNVILVSTDRNGIEIDYCPLCWGVWLDKGELNQIIERSVSEPRVPSATIAAHRAMRSISSPHTNAASCS